MSFFQVFGKPQITICFFLCVVSQKLQKMTSAFILIGGLIDRSDSLTDSIQVIVNTGAVLLAVLPAFKYG